LEAQAEIVEFVGNSCGETPMENYESFAGVVQEWCEGQADFVDAEGQADFVDADFDMCACHADYCDIMGVSPDVASLGCSAQEETFLLNFYDQGCPDLGDDDDDSYSNDVDGCDPGCMNAKMQAECDTGNYPCCPGGSSEANPCSFDSSECCSGGGEGQEFHCALHPDYASYTAATFEMEFNATWFTCDEADVVHNETRCDEWDLFMCHWVPVPIYTTTDGGATDDDGGVGEGGGCNFQQLWDTIGTHAAPHVSAHLRLYMCHAWYILATCQARRKLWRPVATFAAGSRKRGVSLTRRRDCRNHPMGLH
jgi:hypothetical protein